MRIVFDVTPLSHPRTGVGNYIRGSLAGLAEAAGGKHEVVAWAPTSAQGARLVALGCYATFAEAVAVGLIGAISLIRLYLGAHYPIDLLGGWMAGGALLAVIVSV